MVNKLVVSIAETGFREWFTLKNVFFELTSGDILLVTGKSGSGKTTLLRALAGLIDKIGGFIEGYITINGVDIYSSDPEHVASLIAFIPQEPWYGVVGHTVKSEFCHSLSVRNLDCNDDILKRYGFGDIIDRVTYGLSSGQLQRLLLAEAFESKTPVLLLDEPFTYLDQDMRKSVMGEIERFSSEGGIVVVVDHLPDNWMSFDPKTICLDNGEVVEKNICIRDLEVRELNPKLKRKMEFNGEALVKTYDVWFRYYSSNYVLRGVNIEIKRRSVTGLMGPNGSGKSTLLKILAGIHMPSRGKVVRFGKTTYIPENPLLFLTHPTPREELYSAAVNENIITEVIEIFNLKNVLDKPILKLSSGERRRVALASSYVRGYSVYLLDEPTGGLDDFSLKGFIEMISFLREKGSAVLIAHHDHRLRDLFDLEYSLTKGVVVESNR